MGCPKCAGNIKHESNDFIKDAVKIHGKKYNYDNVIYTNKNTKIKIICPEHGEFEQTPSSHIYRKAGCPKCNGGVKYSKDNFIEKANKIHANGYDYSKFDYVNSKIKSIIICSKHGEFFQSAECHIRGQGCPQCGNKKKKSKENL